MMAKKILGFSATPRPRGNSHLLLEQLLAEVKRQGGAPEIIRLAPLKIQPCRGCNHCKTVAEVSCVITDDMQGLYSKILDADGYVFATPIYFFSAAAQMKCFLDRTYALFTKNNYHRLHGKPAALVMTYGADDPLTSGADNALSMFEDIFGFQNMPFCGCVHGSFNDEDEVTRNPALLARAAELGGRLMQQVAAGVR